MLTSNKSNSSSDTLTLNSYKFCIWAIYLKEFVSQLQGKNVDNLIWL